MIKLFAVLNGKILEDLGDNVSATYTRIHYLLNELKEYSDTEVKSISFEQKSSRNSIFVIYNNVIKTAVAIRTAAVLIKDRPIVYFAYPHSLTTAQNRAVFWLCKLLKLQIALDIHDTVEQAAAIGTGRATLNKELERHYFRDSTLILALNPPMWDYLENKYQISQDKRVIFVPNAYEESFCRIYPNIYKSVEDRFNVCYLGGLTKNRGIDILTEACEGLHKKYPYLKLYLFGSYGEGISSELRDTIESGRFHRKTTGSRKDLPGALQEVDLFVMPYDPRESYINFSSPTKLFEYIGTAKPISVQNVNHCWK